MVGAGQLSLFGGLLKIGTMDQSYMIFGGGLVMVTHSGRMQNKSLVHAGYVVSVEKSRSNTCTTTCPLHQYMAINNDKTLV